MDEAAKEFATVPTTMDLTLFSKAPQLHCASHVSVPANVDSRAERQTLIVDILVFYWTIIIIMRFLNGAALDGTKDLAC